MKQSSEYIIKKWIKTWQKADKSLKQIRLQELRADDYYEKNLPILNEMLWYAFEHRKERDFSSLIDHQRKIRKCFAGKSDV